MRKNTGNLNRPPRFRIKDHPYLEKGEGKRERKIEAESLPSKDQKRIGMDFRIFLKNYDSSISKFKY
jgi:hypothetical protein